MYDFTSQMPKQFNPWELVNLSGGQPQSPQMQYSPMKPGVPLPQQGAGNNFTFSWQNPYEYTGWGVGAAEGAGFGGKLGTYLGSNAPLFGAGMDLLSKGVGAYAGLKQLGIAEDALSLEKKRFKTNLANQTQSYNTQMADRIAGRSYASEAERVAALSAAQLPDPNKKKGG